MNTRIINILIADDTSAAREMLKTVISNKGFNVITACSGEEAERLIQAYDFDLLVLDNKMEPGPLGLELCAKYSDEVPVVILSGDDIEEAALVAGATSFILRPVAPNQVMTIIHRLYLKAD